MVAQGVFKRDIGWAIDLVGQGLERPGCRRRPYIESPPDLDDLARLDHLRKLGSGGGVGLEMVHQKEKIRILWQIVVHIYSSKYEYIILIGENQQKISLVSHRQTGHLSPNSTIS